MRERTAVITGASSGIGAALSRHLAVKGYRLHLFGRDQARLSEVAASCAGAGGPPLISVVDLRHREQQIAALAQIGQDTGIDLFVANAGILDGRRSDALTETADVARSVLDTNLVATIDSIHGVLPFMLARRSGTIVLVSSLGGLSPLPDAPAYSAAKAGLIAYGLALHDSLRSHGIKVCVICPGYVATPMGERHRGQRPGSISADEAARRIVKAAEAGRALAGFPFGLYWLARLSALVPPAVRRLGHRGLRFHVDHAGRGQE